MLMFNKNTEMTKEYTKIQINTDRNKAIDTGR